MRNSVNFLNNFTFLTAIYFSKVYIYIYIKRYS